MKERTYSTHNSGMSFIDILLTHDGLYFDLSSKLIQLSERLNVCMQRIAGVKYKLPMQ